MGSMESAGMLSGVVVVEATDTPAAAFAAALAADFGATVIACEPAGTGSGLRRLGPQPVREVWWPVIARNKLSLALAVDHPRAAEVMRRLAARADIVARDDCAIAGSLRAAMDGGRAVDMYLHPTGADRPDLWPWSTRPEFAAAASGLMALTGFADGPAVQPEMPLADYTAGMLALCLALAELRSARRDDRAPRAVPLALHEALHRMNEWQLVVAAARGAPETRNGNRFPMNANIGNVFRTRDGKLLTISAATPSVADRLLEMIGGPALREDPRFSTPAARRTHMDALDAVIAEWMARHDAAEAMRLVLANDVVAGPICDADDLAGHPHLAARGDVVPVPTADGASLPMPAALPMTQPAPGRVRHAGPALGADTDAVLELLGFQADERQVLRREGALA